MNIMFVCTGNSCRSPMAEGLAKDIFEKTQLDATIISRGIQVYERCASNKAIEALKSHELDISNHVASQISHVDVQDSDIILTMTSNHKAYVLQNWSHAAHKLWTLGEYVGSQSQIDDPYGMSQAVYDDVAMQLHKLITQLADKLKERQE